MFNFKKTKEQATDQVNEESNQFENAVIKTNQEEEENKKVHGQNDVCCGSCGGE